MEFFVKESSNKVRINNSNVVFAELVYLPSNGRIANIMQTRILTDYKLNLNCYSNDTINNLELNDLYLVSNGESLLIKSKKLNKEVRIITSHMFNFLNAPKLCKFLIELSNHRYANWSVFNWGILQLNEYLPRVKRNNTILSPQIWNFSLNNGSKNLSDKEILNAIEVWIKKWNIPRYVYLTFADLRLLIDLENKLHIKELINEVKKKEAFTIKEYIGDFEDRIVEGENGKHNMEFVVPVLRRKSNRSRLDESYNINNFNYSSDYDVKRQFHPGSECIYLKIYCNLESQDNFIIELLPFIRTLEANNFINKWFFIRYFDKDLGPHIRLRLFGENDVSMISNVFPLINKFCTKNIERKKIKDFSVHTYNREIERYGGMEFIEKAEELFHFDSEFSAKLLSFCENKQIDINLQDKRIIAVISIIYLVLTLEISYENIKKVLSANKINKSFYNEYQKNKSFLLKVINSNNNWTELQSFDGGEELVNILTENKDFLIKTAQVIDS